VCASIFLFARIIKKNDGKTWQVKSLHSVTSAWRACTPKILFSYRLIVFLYWVGLQMTQLINNPQHFAILQAFTIWNSYLLSFYFGIGSYLSFQCLRNPPSNHSYLTALEKVHYVMLQIELPTSLFVCLVTWTVLLPAAKAINSEYMLLQFFSYNQHAFNVVLMLTGMSS
jgi:hypothetical protein